MRRRSLLVAVWIAGTVAATALASAAVRQVTAEVGPEPPLPLPNTVAVARSSEAGPSDGAAPGARPRASEPGGPQEAAVTESYSLRGGVVTVRYSGGTARVVGSSPASGFTVEVGDPGPPRADVRFRSDTHESRLRAAWSNGRPDVRREENER